MGGRKGVGVEEGRVQTGGHGRGHSVGVGGGASSSPDLGSAPQGGTCCWWLSAHSESIEVKLAIGFNVL